MRHFGQSEEEKKRVRSDNVSRASESRLSRSRRAPGEMTRLTVLLALLPLLSASAHGYLEADELECPKEALVDLTDSLPGAVASDGSLTVDGVYYPADAIRWVEGRAMGCPCRSRGCLSLCCKQGQCQEPVEDGGKFLPIYDPDTGRVDANARPSKFWQFSWDPCHASDRYYLEPDSTEEDKSDDVFELYSNGTLVQPTIGMVRNYSDFCVQQFDDTWRIVLCFAEYPDAEPSMGNVHPVFPVGMLISVPFLTATFVVYMLIAELRNIHGLTLCGYVFSLIVAYIALSTLQIINSTSISDLTCFFYAYIVHFSFLASFFWLNVMCFDIWWTFGGFRTLHGSVKQRERKKFIMYSIYAWGCASALTIVCMIMDFVPNIPDTAIRPGFGKGSCWFSTNWARFIYFYGPMGVTVICNICLFVLTALKILRHKKDTARQLKGSESRRHDDNKQWFNLYLKLFIVMGINWSMEIISWLFENTLPKYVWYITDLTNTLQGVIIFIIFVWKDKIKRLLMKRFGCQGTNFLSRNSTSRSGPTSSASRTTCVTQATMQEKVNPYADSYRAKAAAAAATNHTVTDESDCV